MNHTYRLVWNRALRVLQVASELATSPVGAGGAANGCSTLCQRPLARACAAALALMLGGMALPAWAVCTPSATQLCGIDGGSGGNGAYGYSSAGGAGGTGSVSSGTYTNAGGAGNGGYGDGSAGQGANGSGGRAGGYYAPGDGGIGAHGDGGGGSGGNGGDYGGPFSGSGGGGAGGGIGTHGYGGGGGGGYGSYGGGAGGGGGGGTGKFVSGTTFANPGSIHGGNGGNGGNNYIQGSFGTSFGGSGGGGGGGVGIYATSGSSLTNAQGHTIHGGIGGNGGGGYNSYGEGSNYGGGGGGGGAGVAGLGLALDNAGSIYGGAGGSGGFGTWDGAGDGGSGGAGVSLSQSTLTNSGTIDGGDGGAGGYGWNGGSGGSGGAGVSLSQSTLTNSGTIDGGNGGAGGGTTAEGDNGGVGGAGVYATSGSSLTNSGVIVGGDGGSSGTSNYGSGSWSASGGMGVFLSQSTLTNFGTISGGNGGVGENTWTHGGKGGTGGAGVYATSGSSLTNAQGYTIHGGIGGIGGTYASSSFYGGDGGDGGVGVAGVGLTLDNGGSIYGGAGGAGGYGGRGSSSGGSGGAGVSLSQSTLANSGVIVGGNGGSSGSYGRGSAGNGGVGVLANGGVTIINSGSISGGLSGDGSERADSVEFSGIGNRLTLQSGSSLTGNIELTAGAGAIIDSQASQSVGSNVVLGSGSALVLDTTAGGLNVTGTISGDGALSTSGTSSNSLALSTVNVASVTQNSGSSLTLNGSVTTTGAQNYNDKVVLGADITATSTGGSGIDFAASVDGGHALSVHTGGAITFGTVGGTTALTSLGASSGSFSGGTMDVAGDLSVTTTSGGIVQTGGFTIGGTSSFDAGANDIALTNADNVFSGAVSLAGGTTQITDDGPLTLGTLNTGGLDAVGDGALNLGAGSIAGNLAASSVGGAITQSGGLEVTGTSSIDAGAGAIVLTQAGNDFRGAVSASGTGISISDSANLNIASLADGANGPVSLIAGGTLTLPAGAIDTGTADLTLTSNGGLLTSRGKLSGANISLTGSSGITLADDVTASGNVTLNSSGTMLLTGDLAASGTTAFGSGTLQVGNGGTSGSLSGDVIDSGTLAFDRSDSITLAGAISGNGALIQEGGGLLILTGDSTFAGSTTIDAGSGLQIGSGGTTGSLSGNIVDEGALHFDRSDALTFGGAISGSGALTQDGAGTLTLDGDSSGFTGSTQVRSGKLIVGSVAGNGAAMGGSVGVDSGATLGGHGTLDGNVSVASGGHLAPGDSVGTLTIGGDAVFARGSEFDFEFGAPGADFQSAGTSDSVNVGGNLELDGAVLNISDAGGMGPGLYNLFTYGGTLTETNGGLGFGTTPADTQFQIQNLTADKQINLLDTTGMTLNFWNTDGTATSTQMGGGSGTWSATSSNWTDAQAGVTAMLQPQRGFAIFGGTAGTVTVDDSAGNVSSTGMQFTSDGYVMNGDTLTLVADNGNAPVIRVGDGSSAGAGMTATINNVIAGSGGLVKSDLGTLVLAGANTFSGGLTVNGGTLSVSSDANLGDASNTITLDGSTLRNTASFDTARNVILQNQDTLRTDADLTESGVISGSGGLIKAGSGTLTLTGANTFSGMTTISQGMLALTGDGTLAASSGIVDEGTFDISGTRAGASIRSLSGTGNVALGSRSLTVTNADPTSEFGGALEGSGGLVLTGGNLVLTGPNTFTGATTIGRGTLALTGDGTLAASSGIVDNGTFDISGTRAGASIRSLSGTGNVALGSRSLTVTNADPASEFGGTLEGSGGLVLTGGNLVLTGANTFTGGATISGGTLQIGNGGATGSLAGNIDDNSVLVFDRSDATTFTGVIAGAGSLVQNGVGQLTLNGNSSAFAGTTAVHAGALIVGDDNHANAELSGNVVVDAGAMLGGIGTVGNLDMAGTLGPGNSVGTLHVNGNAVFEAGSTFVVDTNADASSDHLAATGAVTIQGGNILVIARGSNWAARTEYTIISAQGGVSGQFASASDNLIFLDPVLSYGSNAVELSLERNDINFNVVANTMNQHAVGSGANGLGWNSSLYKVLVFLDPATARAAFDRLSGELHASQQTARADDSRFVREAMDLRLQQEGTGKLDAWIHAWDHWDALDGNGNTARLNGNGDGLLVGVDLPVGTQGRVGFMGGSARDSLNVQDRNSWGHLTSDWLGVYGELSHGSLALRGGLAYSWDAIPLNRDTELSGMSARLSSNATGDTLTDYIEGAWKIRTRAGEFEPYLDLAHVQLSTSATTETGGDAALHVNSERENVEFGTLGARGSWQVGNAELHGGLGWQHAFGDTTPARTMRFVGGGDAFTIYGVPVAQTAAVVNLGANWRLASNVRLDVSYNGQWANRAKDQAAKLSLDVSF